MSDVTRREFLRYTVAGAAALATGLVLGSCGKGGGESRELQRPAASKAPGKQPEAAVPPEVAQTAKDPAHMTEAETLHVPQFALPAEIKKGKKMVVTINVGKTPHPMEKDHYIEWIELSVDGKVEGKAKLKPGRKPMADFKIKPAGGAQELKCHIHCNVHKLWENTQQINAV
jgi:superoxide reductase